MKVCPVAIAVGCAKCPVFKVCPLKSVLGDQPAKADSPAAQAAPAGERWTALEALVADLRRFGDPQIAIDLKSAVGSWRAALEQTGERVLPTPPPDVPRVGTP